MSLKTLIAAIERRTGEDIAELRSKAIDTRRAEVEKRKGPTMIVSFFPVVGRGSVLHDRTVSRKAVEEQVDDALKASWKERFAFCRR